MLINEIFSSIDGEGIRAGYPVTFIRSFGCNLKCHYCFGSYEGKYPRVFKKDYDKDTYIGVPINDIKIGDYILAMEDADFMPLSDELVDTKVTNISNRQVSDYYKLTMIDGLVLTVTGDHPFYVKTSVSENVLEVQKKAVSELDPKKDRIMFVQPDSMFEIPYNIEERDDLQKYINSKTYEFNNNGVIFSDGYIDKIEKIDESLLVYNITTEHHNYIIEGLCVHNCDSLYAVDPETEEDKQNAFKEMSIDDIVSKCEELKNKRITFTGGEPLLQKDAKELILALIDKGFEVNIETNGAVDIESFDESLGWIKGDLIYTMDYKCPSSGMEDKMILRNINYLTKHDVLKFVVGSIEDLDKMKQVIKEYESECQIFVSPVFGKIEPKDIVKYILDNDLQQVRIQLQMHKFIWPSDMRGV